MGHNKNRIRPNKSVVVETTTTRPLGSAYNTIPGTKYYRMLWTVDITLNCIPTAAVASISSSVVAQHSSKGGNALLIVSQTAALQLLE
jgi:hypothetical protein